MDELRRHPYRLLFPLGVALSWTGVGHWALHATGWLLDYRPRFHAIAQTQGFMTCMVLGFLFTMIPRRTETSPPSAGQLMLAAAGPVAITTAAWAGRWALAHGLWILVAITAVIFIAARFDGPGEAHRPSGFVWIPASFLMGIAGSLTVLLVEAGALSFRVLQLGQGLVQQGFLLGLVLGVGGSLALPLMTRGERPAAPVSERAHRRATLAHAAAAVVLAGSFWIEVNVSLSWAMGLRAAVALAVLLGPARHWRLPRRTGANARLVWLAAWMVPAGYAMAALWPRSYRGGLHVTFIGGFTLLALAVSAQVLLGHGGYTRVARAWPASAIAVLLLTGAATLVRVLMEADRAAMFEWMGWSAGLFLAATVAWVLYTGRAILRPARDG